MWIGPSGVSALYMPQSYLMMIVSSYLVCLIKRTGYLINIYAMIFLSSHVFTY
jgi:hypothetical protein